MGNKPPFHGLWVGLLVLLAGAFVGGMYSRVAWQPNEYMFSSSGDGLKNYYTWAWQLRYDSTALHFSGMHYPYGEHVFYTDGHPLAAAAIRLFSPTTGLSGQYAVGLLNAFMLIALAFHFIALYLLLLHFRLPPLFALFFALSIGFLSPQVFRLSGHYSLSYSLAIPFSWWLFLKCRQGKPRINILLILNLFFWLFINAYLGVMIIFFLGATALVGFLSKGSQKGRPGPFALQLLLMAMPLIFYVVFLQLTDDHAGRNMNPSGFFLYNAEPDDVLLPHDKPLRPLFNSLTGNSIRQQWEAWSYVGIVQVLLVFFIGISAAFSLVSRRPRQIVQELFSCRMLNAALVSGFFCLLFAMAIPFKQFPMLTDVFPFVKQFRATGRFTWPFFYAFSVFSAASLYRLALIYSNKTGRKWVFIALFAAAAIGIAEGWPYHQKTAKAIRRSPNLFHYEQLPEGYKNALRHTDTSRYQAIISLPFYHSGSETFTRTAPAEAMQHSMVFAYHSGLPLVCSSLSRTSVPESKNIIQLLSPEWVSKTLQHDLPSKKDFLIIKSHLPLSPCEKAVTEKSRLFFEGKDFSLLEISCEKLFKEISRDTIFHTDSLAFLYHESFDATPSDTAFLGKGSLRIPKKGRHTLASFAPHTFKSGKSYHFSCWFYNGKPWNLNHHFQLRLEVHDAARGRWQVKSWFPEFSEVIYGDWSLTEGCFQLDDASQHVYIRTWGKSHSKGDVILDELVVSSQRQAASLPFTFLF